MLAGIKTPRVPLVLITILAFKLLLELFSGLLFAHLITSLSWKKKKMLLRLSVVFEMYGVSKTPYDLLLFPLLVFSLLLLQTSYAAYMGEPPPSLDSL